MINKIKKITPIIITIIVIIGIFIVFKKIEAPIIPINDITINSEKESPIEEIVKNTSVSNKTTLNESKIDTTVITEKYIIKNRSTVIPIEKNGNRKVVLLTIDDGPTKRTLDIINILKKHDAKAIFFINGMFDKNNSGIIKQTAKDGFAIGNHTWNHQNLKKINDIKIIENEINRNSDLINTITGNNPRFFRAPYGESTQQIRKIIKDDGMIFMDWSDTAKDWEISSKDVGVFIKNVTDDLHDGSIILMHEHPWSLQNLDALLSTLDSLGYSYVNPDNIIE